MVGKLLEQKSATFGYDAQNEKYVDFIDAGIVDPTKVVRVALQNAASVAALLITTEAMIADRPKKDAPRRCRAAAAWAAWTAWTFKPCHGRAARRARPGHPVLRNAKGLGEIPGLSFSPVSNRCP